MHLCIPCDAKTSTRHQVIAQAKAAAEPIRWLESRITQLENTLALYRDIVANWDSAETDNRPHLQA
jgi:hypothetical protein